jgi:hypothetical protein
MTLSNGNSNHLEALFSFSGGSSIAGPSVYSPCATTSSGSLPPTLGPNSASHPPFNELYHFIRAGISAAATVIALGRGTAATRLKEWCIRAHRLANFGANPEDTVLVSSTGSGTVPHPSLYKPPTFTIARSPTDLVSWIAAEERCRTALWVVVWDSTASDAQGTRITLSSCGYYLFRGQILCSQREGTSDESDTFEQGKYGHLPMPCPEDLFDALPSIEYASTWTEHPLFLRLQAWFPLPYRLVQEWMDLPRGSSQRNWALQNTAGCFLSHGYAFIGVFFTGTQSRMVLYKDYCLARGFMLNSPPTGPEGKEAREMRESLDGQLRDIAASFPDGVAEAEERGDTKAIRELATRYWNPRLGSSL